MENQERKLLITFFIIFYAVILLRNGWICDDAFISFRVIDNFINGFGLRWNVVERVQAYTHPLWIFLLTPFYALLGNMYLTALFVSLVLSIGTVAFYGFKLASSTTSACLGILILCLSDAFIDYSTSGLENPLTFFIIVIFLYIYLKKPDSLKKIFYLSLFASLGVVNRLDTILIFLPMLAFSFWQIRTFRAVKVVLLGFTPLILWELFSLFYYGFPFPNTAYAKLTTGLGNDYLIPQGLAYLHASLVYDPLTILVLILGITIPLVLGKHRLFPIVGAIVLYLLYVVKIGGCFMYGRHLSAPLLVAVITLGYLPLSSRKTVIGLAGIILLLGISTSRSPLFYEPTDNNQDISSNKGICDERSYYNPTCGFGNYNFDSGNWPKFIWVREGKQFKNDKDSFIVSGNVGMQGFFSGPYVNILDYHALTDPLLARLPVKKGIPQRIGHFERKIPKGYSETVETGKNVLSDTSLSAYYDKLVSVTRGDLFDSERFLNILKFNTGQFNYLLNEYLSPHYIYVSFDSISTRRDAGIPWNVPGNIIIDDIGLEIKLPELYYARQIELGHDHNDEYRILFYKDSTRLGEVVIQESSTLIGGITRSALDIPPEIGEEGFNLIRVLPAKGDGMYSVSHIVFPDSTSDGNFD